MFQFYFIRDVLSSGVNCRCDSPRRDLWISLGRLMYPGSSGMCSASAEPLSARASVLSVGAAAWEPHKGLLAGGGAVPHAIP